MWSRHPIEYGTKEWCTKWIKYGNWEITSITAIYLHCRHFEIELLNRWYINATICRRNIYNLPGLSTASIDKDTADIYQHICKLVLEMERTMRADKSVDMVIKIKSLKGTQFHQLPTITWKRDFKYLGVIIDNKLSFSVHCQVARWETVAAKTY